MGYNHKTASNNADSEVMIEHHSILNFYLNTLYN
jgi:hypothetical protein